MNELFGMDKNELILQLVKERTNNQKILTVLQSRLDSERYSSSTDRIHSSKSIFTTTTPKLQTGQSYQSSVFPCNIEFKRQNKFAQNQLNQGRINGEADDSGLLITSSRTDTGVGDRTGGFAFPNYLGVSISSSTTKHSNFTPRVERTAAIRMVSENPKKLNTLEAMNKNTTASTTLVARPQN